MRTFRTCMHIALGIVLGASGFVGLAVAQNLQNLEPAMGLPGGVSTSSARVVETGSWLTSFGVNYARRPLVSREDNAEISEVFIDRQLGLDLGFTYGIYDGFELSLAMPVGYVSGPTLSEYGGDGFAPGDLRLGARWQFGGDVDSNHAFGLGLEGTAPTGDSDRFYGSSGVTLTPRVFLEHAFIDATLVASMGIRYRSSHDVIENVELGNEFLYSVAAAIPLDWSDFLLVGEVFGATPLTEVRDAKEAFPAEGVLGLRFIHSIMTVTGGFAFALNPDRGVPGHRVFLMATFGETATESARTRSIPVPTPEPVGRLDDSPAPESVPIAPGTGADAKDASQPSAENPEESSVGAAAESGDDAPADEGTEASEEDSEASGADDDATAAETPTEGGDDAPADEGTEASEEDSEASGADDDATAAAETPAVKASGDMVAAKTRFETPSNNLDQDGDGVPDPQDSCPKAPEDRDDFDDDDGCPDPDNDADGVPDDEDRCPLEAGVRSPNAEMNGCPGTAAAAETERLKPKTSSPKAGLLEVSGPIRFMTGKATLIRESLAPLDELAARLKSSASPELVAIEGHSSAHGALKKNIALSGARARTVRDYLVKQGVNEERLTYVGYGSTQPLVPHEDPKAHRINRRVQFRAVSAADAPYGIESVEMGAGDALLQLVFSLGRSITKDDVEINRDGDAVILIRLNGAQVERVWAELKDPLIKRALIHPSTEVVPAGVLRVRMTSAIPEAVSNTASVKVDGKRVTVTLPRW